MKVNRKQLRRLITEFTIPNPVHIDDTDELRLQVAMKIKDMMPPEEAIMMNPADFKALAVSVYEDHFDPEGEGWEPYPEDLEAIEDHLTIVPEPGDPDYEPPMAYESASMKITKRQLRKLIREAMPKGGAPDVMGAMGGGKFQPRNYDVLDYEDWVKEEGHVTAASSSVMATYFLSHGIESQGLMKKLADHFKIDVHDVMRDYDRQEAEGNVVRGEGVLRISESRLRKIVSQSMLTEMLPPGHEVPRSVQADFDIASKEDTFPKRKEPKPKAPAPQEKQTYEKIVADVTQALQGMPGFESHMAGQAATVELPVDEVTKALQPLLTSMGANITDGQSSAGSIAVSHPAAPDMRMYVYQLSGAMADPNVPTTEIDFGSPPGGHN